MDSDIIFEIHSRTSEYLLYIPSRGAGWNVGDGIISVRVKWWKEVGTGRVCHFKSCGIQYEKKTVFPPPPHRKSIFRYNLWQKNKTKQIYMQVDVGPLMFGICTMPSRILLGRLSQLLSFLSTKFKFKILFN